MRETVTSGSGVYTVPDLMVGHYEVTFQAPAFKKLVRSGITLDVTQVVRVDATMEVGAVTESVEVTGQLPYINTDTPEVGRQLEPGGPAGRAALDQRRGDIPKRWHTRSCPARRAAPGRRT